jgi:hypothetical protein
MRRERRRQEDSEAGNEASQHGSAADSFTVTRRADGATVIAIRGRARLLPRLVVTAILGVPGFLLYKAVTMHEWFAVVFVGAIGAVFLLAAASIWFGSSTVTVLGERILICHFPRLWLAGRHDLERRAFLGVQTAAHPEFGRKHYSLWIARRGGEPVCATPSVPTLGEAERLQAAIEVAIRSAGAGGE